MDIEFDPGKDAINQKRHGLSLAKATDLNWDAALIWMDDRFEYDEIRLLALAPDTSELFYVVFVDEIEVLRIISLRYADKSERRLP